MTGRRVGLIRGINVGKAKRVAMADLRAVVEGLGYVGVSTLLNSGNVVFGVPDGVEGEAGPRIEGALAARLGVSARVIVLTAEEVAEAVGGNPLIGVATDPARLLVTVLARPADRAKLVTLAAQDWAPEALAVGARVAYVWSPDGVLASRLGAAVAKALGDGATSRNWATMLKLGAMAEAGP